MRTKLLASVAAIALIGCSAMAVAQQDEHGGAAKPGASEQHPGAPGGAAQHAQPGGAMQHAQPGGAAQSQVPEKGEPKGMSQGQQPGKEMQRGAEEDKSGKEGVKPEEHAQSPAGGKPEEHAQTPAGGKPEGSAQTEQRGGEGAAAKGAGGKSVQLSDSQRTQIKSVIVRDRNVARVNSVNFNISVGARVTRDVHFVVLPADVVTIVPEYQGYDYIIVGDQLLIIDPDTLEIVAILPA
jgi:hypothetical protein